MTGAGLGDWAGAASTGASAADNEMLGFDGPGTSLNSGLLVVAHPANKSAVSETASGKVLMGSVKRANWSRSISKATEQTQFSVITVSVFS